MGVAPTVRVVFSSAATTSLLYSYNLHPSSYSKGTRDLTRASQLILFQNSDRVF